MKMNQKMEILKRTVRHIAEKIEPNIERRALLLNVENMIAWKAVFTDPTVSAENYDPFELMGDKVSNKLVAARAIKLYPNLTEKELTNLVAHYGSNKVFAQIMKEYNILVKIKGKGEVSKNIVQYTMFRPDSSVKAELTDSIYADMFEAIMGGLYMIGDSILDGLGDIYCRRWFEHIYITRYPEFDARVLEGNAKQIVETLFSRFNFYVKTPKEQKLVSYEKKDEGTGLMSVTGWYVLHPALIKYMTELSKTVPNKRIKNIAKYNKEITLNEGGQTSDVKLTASERLLKWLKDECGIDAEWAERTKSILDAKEIEKNPEMGEKYEIIRNFLRKKGLNSNFYFKNLAKYSVQGKTVGIQIRTTDKAGNEKVVFTRVETTGSAYDARQMLINDFVEAIPNM